jgi:hypothetical protein
VLDNVFLPKLGINRNMKGIAVYAPLDLGGISFPSIETIQDQKGITLFLQQLQWGKEVAGDLHILISRAQLDSGLVHLIMDDTTLPVPYLEPGLISHSSPDLASSGAALSSMTFGLLPYNEKVMYPLWMSCYVFMASRKRNSKKSIWLGNGYG